MKKHSLKVLLVLGLATLLGACENASTSFSIDPSVDISDISISEGDISEISIPESISIEESESSQETTTSEEENSSKGGRIIPSSSESSEEESSSESVEQSSSYVSESESTIEESSSQYSSSTPTSSIETDSRWNVDFSTYGATFRNTLSSCIASKKTKTCSYSACLSIGAKAAAYPNKNSSTFVPFYHDTSTTTTTSSCNREHTWPKSRGGDSFETDPFMVRPTLTKDNSSRGNNFYGNSASNEWDPASCGYEGARGEAARIIFYCATRYYSSGVSLSNNPSDSSGKNTMGTLKTLLEWNEKYPVTAIEEQINDYLSDNGYGRNPFVDHPDYANFIYDKNGVRTTPYITVETGTGDTSSSYSSSETTYKYNKVSDLSSLDGKTISIVNISGTEGFALTSEAISEKYPWYQTAQVVELNSDKSKMNLCGDESLATYKITKLDDTYYSIYSTSKKAYLYNYVYGTHVSITWDSTVSYDGELSNKWNLVASGEGFNFLGSTSVYLTYNTEHANFQGSSSANSTPLYIYC